jgi:hypothetical protein
VSLKLGMRIRNNDARVGQNIRKIVAFTYRVGHQYVQLSQATHVFAENGSGVRTRIRINRIHTDGKSRRSGWSIVS